MDAATANRNRPFKRPATAYPWVRKPIGLLVILILLCTAVHAVSAAETYVTFTSKFGSNGSEDGQFNNGPGGVAIDDADNLYVLDNGNHRIQKFTSAGTFLTKWGSDGIGNADFYPIGIAVDGAGDVYVTYHDPEPSSEAGHLVQKFASNGTFLMTWGSYGSGEGQFDHPAGIATDDAGNVYVADLMNHRVQKFTTTGTFLTQWDTEGSGDGEISGPWGIAVDHAGNVYVTDVYQHRVQKFTSTGTFVTRWGSSGFGEGQFKTPKWIAVDRTGNVYVVDSRNYRLQTFDSNGAFLEQWGRQGVGDGEFFSNPEGIATDSAGNIYVSDPAWCRVQKFAPASSALAPGWNATLGGSAEDEAMDVHQTSDGGYIVAGYSQSNQSGDVGLNHGAYDSWVVKLDGAGQKVWNVTLGGDGLDMAKGVEQASDEGFIVAGDTKSNQSGDVGLTHGGFDFWVMKLDGTGQKVWNVTLGGSSSDTAAAMERTSDGGCIVVGNTESSRSGDVGLNHGDRTYSGSWTSDYWVVKLDGAGQKVWNVTLGGIGNDYATAVKQTSDGGYIVAGYILSSMSGDVGRNHGEVDAWVVKLDGAGQKVWNATLGGYGDDYAADVVPTHDGGYLVVGNTESSQSGDVGLTHGGSDLWVVKLDGAGQKVWNVTLGGSGNDRAGDVEQTSDGGFFVVGSTSSSMDGDVGRNHGADDAWVVKISDTGAIQSQRLLGGGYPDNTYSGEQTNDGGNIVAGSTYSSMTRGVGLNHGEWDLWVVKLGPSAQELGVITVPGGAGLPSDTNKDGLYNDVNGNGRPDFADVVLYFNQMTWIADHEPVGIFDYNGNGRIDFADVVWLFNSL